MKKVSDMKYKVVFNNRVGNIGTDDLEDAIRMSKNVVNYKLADVAMILQKIGGHLKAIQFISRQK